MQKNVKCKHKDKQKVKRDTHVTGNGSPIVYSVLLLQHEPWSLHRVM